MIKFIKEKGNSYHYSAVEKNSEYNYCEHIIDTPSGYVIGYTQDGYTRFWYKSNGKTYHMYTEQQLTDRQMTIYGRRFACEIEETVE